jgi:hypothetical protein
LENLAHPFYFLKNIDPLSPIEIKFTMSFDSGKENLKEKSDCLCPHQLYVGQMD